jgi:co-chaperonin GroES (HSP10)
MTTYVPAASGTNMRPEEMSVASMEEQVQALTEMLYATHSRRFVPRYPWVFVRVISKEQVYKGVIHLPASEQNKVNHEGIVLATWKPIVKYDGELAWQKCSELKPGDRVLFPHWAGLPIVKEFKDTQYRIVKECEWLQSQEGGIFATVEYPERERSPSHKLREILNSSYCQGNKELIAECIEEQFLLVDRDEQSVTLSGR